MMILMGLLLAVAAIISPIEVDAVGSPVGFGAGTTGGEGGVTVTPTTLAQLKNYLCEATDSNGYCNDGTKRIIIIDRTFDFRNSMGHRTETGCKVMNCANGDSDLAINKNSYCNGRSPATVTYDVAGVDGRLLVGSNKSILGVKNTGIIKGTGFKIEGGVSNIIIQNIELTDINEGVVWGGDGILINGASKVWIDHNYFARIGRQMIVTGYGNADRVTISNNVFDGNTKHGAYCDGRHYWLWLFLGKTNTITLYRNYIQNTSGRGPHSGGLNNANVQVHMVNNYFKNVQGQGAIMSRTGTSYILAEGNFFVNVSYPVYKDTAQLGLTYAPFSTTVLATCSSHIKRSCVENYVSGASSSWNYIPHDVAVLNDLASHTSSLITPAGASTVPTVTTSNAGVGKVN